MKRSFLAIGTVVLSTLMLVGCSRRTHTVEEKADWVVEKISKELELTQDQRAKLTAIKRDILGKKDLIESWKYGEIFDEALAQIKTESLDKGKLNTMLAQLEAKRTELRTLLVNKAAEFHAVLTPQQRTKAVEKLGRFREHFLPDGKTGRR